MKRFAQIDDNNKVLQVINCESLDFITQNYEGRWVETFEENMAGIDDIYDEVNNKFVNPNADYTIMTLEEYEASKNL
jgi:hypothetical protein